MWRPFTIALAALLASCGPGTPPRMGGPGEAVLVLAPPNHATVAMVGEALARRGHAANGDKPALRMDFREASSGAEATTVVRGLLPQIAQYKAIYSPSQTLARAAQLEVAHLPIVFDGVDDPVVNCLVDSLRHPGRNATGYMHLLPDSEAKMLELLHDAFPAVKEVAVLASGLNVLPLSCDPADPVWRGERPPCQRGLHGADASVQRLVEAERIETFGRKLGLSVQFLVMCEPADFDLLRKLASKTDTLGFLVPWHTLFDNNIPALVSALASTRRPVIYPNSRFTDAGGLLSLEPIRERGLDRPSLLALLQVLDGHPPAELPVQSPRGFEIVFNAATAAQLGLQPSPFLLRRADRTLQP